MAHFIDNLRQFFEEFLRCVREGMAGLSSEYELNRVDGLLWRLTDFERTLGLISSRVGERGKKNNHLLVYNNSTKTTPQLYILYKGFKNARNCLP